jgi:ATP-dependent helicase/nuclease subunit A
VSQAADRQAQQAQLQEHRRLLYVALTRAREHLIIAGWRRKTQATATWYDWISAGMARLGARRAPSSILPGETLEYGDRPAAAPAQLGLPIPDHPAAAPAPPWLRRPASAEPSPPRAVAPSRMIDDAAPSPLAAAAEQIRRGRTIHRLLQSLPGLAGRKRDAALDQMLADPLLALGADEQSALRAEVRAVLDAPEFAALFAPGTRAEVPLAGMVGDHLVSGQIDRLVVRADQVLVVDYKTDRSPPATADQVPPAYLRQMGAYRTLLRQIYRDREVRCALLWTVGPHLMALDEAVLA